MGRVGSVLSEAGPRIILQKKEKKLLEVTSHVCAETTHVALTPSELSCRRGVQTVSTVPSVVKIGFGVSARSVRDRNLAFTYGLYNR